MAENKGRFRIETERENLSALFGLWVGIWTVLLLLGGGMLIFEILTGIHAIVAIGGMVAYVFLMFSILWTRTKKLIYILASAMVEMEIKSRARKKTQEEKGEDNG